jgi:hypothetical protein
MGFQPRSKAPRGFNRPKRAKSKTRSKKSRLIETYSEKRSVPSQEEVVSRTLNSLRSLGDQIFASAPFSEHFDRWLMNLQTVLTDLESSQAVTLDDQFREERSRIFSNIESDLRDRRLKEASRAEAVRSLLKSKNMLLEAEQEHIAAINEFKDRKEHTIKPFMDKVEVLQEELDDILHTRVGFLKGILRKTKAQSEEEVTLRLASAKKELEESERSFAAEEVSLGRDYERRKLEILNKIVNNKREIERLETASQIDDSAEVRRDACENLADAVNALLKRTGQVSEDAGSPS